MTSVNKDEKILDLFDSRSKLRMKCTNCKEKVFSKKLRQKLEEWIEFAGDSYKHPLDQLQSKSDILYFECPKCEKGATFEPV